MEFFIYYLFYFREEANDGAGTHSQKSSLYVSKQYISKKKKDNNSPLTYPSNKSIPLQK